MPLTQPERELFRRATKDPDPEFTGWVRRVAEQRTLFSDIPGALPTTRLTGDIPTSTLTGTISASAITPVAPVWTSLDFVPSWRHYVGGAPYTPAQFTKDPMTKVVRLRGLVDANSTESATQFICDIGTGYRPAAGRRHVFSQATASGAQRVDVLYDGGSNHAVIWMGTTTGGWLSLDGIQWIAEA